MVPWLMAFCPVLTYFHGEIKNLDGYIAEQAQQRIRLKMYSDSTEIQCGAFTTSSGHLV